MEDEKEYTGQYSNAYDLSINSKEYLNTDNNYQRDDFNWKSQNYNLKNQLDDNEAYYVHYYRSDNIDEPEIYNNILTPTNKQSGLEDIKNNEQNINNNQNNKQFSNENWEENKENVIYGLTIMKKLLYMLHDYSRLFFKWTINKINYLMENVEIQNTNFRN